MLFKGTFNYYGENIVLETHAKSAESAFDLLIKELAFQLDRTRISVSNYFRSGKDNYLVEQKTKGGVMYCAKCGAEVAGTTKTVEEIARKVCREERHIENDRMRAIAREVLLVEYEKRGITSRESYLRAGEKWTTCEDNILKAELAAFFAATARKHERSHGAIVSRIKQINEREF